MITDKEIREQLENMTNNELKDLCVKAEVDWDDNREVVIARLMGDCEECKDKP